MASTALPYRPLSSYGEADYRIIRPGRNFYPRTKKRCTFCFLVGKLITVYTNVCRDPPNGDIR
ncbi:hypothetical protein PENNAL_c0036G03196 [Penicillium nalgiovense]|uniref:Uncharacterized protein n=1 Tax=Penicillium nalgiovense TaxID=60175 RepID=A0A1V6Y567_PENNA|nr:hypothetical protein PENNAL_c0036G03196 [Penicillium nalgiovense]